MEGKHMKEFHRRQLVRDGAAAAAVWSLASLAGCKMPAGGRAAGDGKVRPFGPLHEGDRVDAGGSSQQVAEKAFQLGRDLMKQHGGCARCTVAALQEAMQFVPQDASLRRSASVLDGGATPRGVQSCGAFTGAGLFIGWLCGTEEFKNPVFARKLLKRVYQQFESQYGSVLCKDVRPKAASDCPKVVGLAAQWTTEAVLSQFASRRDNSPA
jgi:hypothetical protein